MSDLITLDELKKVQIEILDEVHNFCINNHITYFLSSGTLIGAVRHKGYIPWDDDIDLYMPRVDYERFVQSFNLNEDLYRVFSLQTDNDCSIAFAKVERLGTRVIEAVDNPIRIGVNIDIFPIDGVPDDNNTRVKYFSRIEHLRNKMVLKDVSIDFKKRSIIKNSVLLFSKLLLIKRSLRSLAQELDGVIDKGISDSQYVCNLVMGNGLHSVFSREAIKDSVDVEFEGKLYKTMAGYDEYLTNTYGDYMMLPPLEKRVSHHSFTAFWQ